MSREYTEDEPTEAEIDEVLRLGREQPLSEEEARRLLQRIVGVLNKRLPAEKAISDSDIEDMLRLRRQA